ncbi:MAG: hypothetical protein D8M57_19980 [Candidatus Scalindua sp. AMX11]|nr:MAG: hypothetical protein D8M57_19980 [Candidatus Scalindua sp. AMX11]
MSKYIDFKDKAYYDEHFKEFLVNNWGFDKTSIPSPSLQFSIDETFGQISLKMDLLTMENIHTILKERHAANPKFGEKAVTMGYINREQSEKILQFQLSHRNLNLLEKMVLNKQLKQKDIWKIMSEYDPPEW